MTAGSAAAPDGSIFYEVIIAGAGPVGMTAALALGRKGHRVLVLEAGSDLNAVSRASTVHASTLELLDELGVAQQVIDAGQIIDRLQYRDLDQGIIAEFPTALMASYTKFAMRLQTEQSEITQIIRTALGSCQSVTIAYDSRVTNVTQDDDEAIVTAVDQHGAETCHRGAYVLGADGAHSGVRGALGIKLSGDTYETRYLVIMTPFDVLSAMPDLAPVTYIWGASDMGGVIALHDHTRISFSLRPDETIEESAASESVQARLRSILPPLDKPYPVNGAYGYTLHRRVADTFRVGRVLLAGDAAHLNSPAGGMGMNSGIHDAYVAAKTLSAVLLGAAGDAALDAYAHMRHGVAVGFVQFRSDRNYRDQNTDPGEQLSMAKAALARTAADERLARDYLLRESMFDTAPRVLW